MAGVEEHAEGFNLAGAVGALIISAFGFVAALFWRDAIQALINEFVPEGQGIIYSFIAAILVTIIAVMAIFVIKKMNTISAKVKNTKKK